MVELSLRDKVKSSIGGAIIFLKGEKEKTGGRRPIYTEEELKELYRDKDIEKFPKKSEE